MDERLRFVARLLEGEKMAPLCAEFVRANTEAGSSRPVAMVFRAAFRGGRCVQREPLHQGRHTERVESCRPVAAPSCRHPALRSQGVTLLRHLRR